jgi:hypothetical protein
VSFVIFSLRSDRWQCVQQPADFARTLFLLLRLNLSVWDHDRAKSNEYVPRSRATWGPPS